MQKSKIKVSVIVPVYNVEKYLGQCLTSLVNQTLEDIEIIVVNDGSPDNSQSIIDEFVKKYPKIVKSFIKENGGLSDARNFGVSKANGEYIGFVDSDDYVREDMFALLYNKAKLEKSDIVICNFTKFTDEGISNQAVIKNIKDFNSNIETTPQILFQSRSYAWNKLYRRDWYLENDFKYPLNQWFEDSAITYNMLYMAKTISAVEENLYFYRSDRNDSITNSINKKVFDIFKSCKSIMDFYRSHSKNQDVLQIAERMCQVHIFARLRFLLRNANVQIKLNFYNEMLKFFNEYNPDWYKNPYYINTKNKNLSSKIRHIPILMYGYLMIPNSIKVLAKKILRRKKLKKEKNNYINNDRLRQLQLLELTILKEIDKICKENNITYYLGEGTLLGAIRHQGFIPWDDDLDIVMPRDDYEKFISIANEKLNDPYVLLNEKTYGKYYLPFSKVISCENHGYINKLDKFDSKYNGPFVDIFPLDSFNTDNKQELEFKYKKVRKIRDMLLLKANYFKPKSKKRKFYKFLSNFYSNDELYYKLNKELKEFNLTDSEFLCNFASSYHPSKQLVKKDVYGKPKYVKFEDGLFPVPNKAETLLTTIYGNYMQLPLVKNRKCKHGFYDETSIKNIAVTKMKEDEETNKLILEEIRKLQLYSLDILKELDRVCKENNITYYLGEGTLLGAIRHQGFIPWDDDIDVLMPRDDLNKFMKLCDEKLDKKYKFQFYTNIKEYWVLSPKIRFLGNTEFNQTELLKYTKNVGPYIDIFPLDYSSNSLKKLEMQGKYIKFYRRLLFLKTNFSKAKKIKHKILKFYSKFISTRKIHERVQKIETKYSNKSKKYITNFGSYYCVRKETFPTEVFGKPKYVKFEDGLFPVPNDYEYVLKTIYGNYMILPPKNKQVGKHSFNR